MDGTRELGEFLQSRRALLQPADVGLTPYGMRRRVPGLRREELAQLAGVSAAYYTRLEQGHSRNASAQVLDAIATALRLDSTERAHLRDLARPTRTPKRTATRPESLRPHMRQLLESMPDTPALVLGRHDEVLAWNRLAHALLAGHLPFDSPADPRTRPVMARLLFLDAHTQELHDPWREEAERKVAHLRMQAGRFPGDTRLAALIGELTMKSQDFAELWARRRVHECTYDHKRLRHPLVGAMTLTYQVLTQPDLPGQQFQLYSAEPDSPSQAALRLLADMSAAPTSTNANMTSARRQA